MAASLVPSFRCSRFVYADTSTDQWETVTTNQELAEAFRYYCKSRNLVIEGSLLDALTQFTTNSFNTICNTLGIDSTALQAHLKRSVDSNGRVQFLFDEFGVTAYNRIFAEFLQNNNLEVGDEVEDDTIYSGKVFTDLDGDKVLCTILNRAMRSAGGYDFTSNDILAYGVPFRVNGVTLYNQYGLRDTNGSDSIGSVVYHVSNRLQNPNYTCLLFKYRYSSYNFNAITNTNSTNNIRKGSVFYGNYSSAVTNMRGYVTMYYSVVSDTFALGGYSKDSNGNEYGEMYTLPFTDTDISNNPSNNVIILITTNNNTINNNTYNDNKQTVINNEGDTYNYDYDDDDPPINPPSGGGDDPSGSPDDWGIDLPDLNIDWLLTGKENKFPFNIPFNIILTLSLLNAEPEAPHFEGTIDLGVYQWDYEIDLEQFDPVAEVCRNFEFIAFLIGLMLLTKRLIWG